MKEKIIELLGKNHKTPLDFNKQTASEVYGLYTYKGDVFCFKDSMDIPFDSLSNKEQKETFNLVQNKKYVLNATLQ